MYSRLPWSRTPRFEYKPLQYPSTSIRLIHLLPSQSYLAEALEFAHLSSPLLCHISSVPITSCPPYKALSYTWGEPSQTHPIFISGHKYLITPSLATALKHIRHPTDIVTLWIDQICINQTDLQEKNQQLPLMSQIYSGAEQVLIWLGPAADRSDLLMDVWDRVGRMAQAWGLESYYTKERLPELGRITAKSDPNDGKTIEFQNLCQTVGPTFDIKAMDAWYGRPWFSRVWIVQEFCLGADAVFVCGHRKVPITLVFLARQIFDFYIGYTMDENTPRQRLQEVRSMIVDPTPPLFAARNRRRKFERNDGTGDSLLQLLQRLYVGMNAQATDPKDMIFGLLALANDTNKLGIIPDYGLAVKQIYTKTSRLIIQNGELDLIGLSQFPKRSNSLPSWVPDWRGPLQPSFCNIGPSSLLDKHLFSASDSNQPSLTETDDESLLGIEGYLVDEIEEVGAPWKERESGSEFDHVPYLSYFSQIKAMCIISANKDYDIYQRPERRGEGFWRIPVGDVEETTTHDTRRATPSSLKGYQQFIANCESFEQSRLISSDAEYKDLSEQGRKDESFGVRYRSRIYEMRNKRPYISKKGYVGMGPATTNPGDSIVVLIGARVPYVLRPLGEERMFLLGEAYCDGIMDGEIVARQDKQSFILV
jgi:hypothetical protein